MLRSVIVSLSACLAALDVDEGSWGSGGRLGLFGALLNLCVDPRDRVRRAAQSGAHRILCRHALAAKRSETLLTKASVQFFSGILRATTLKDSVRSVHTMSFLRSALPLLPAASIGAVLEAVLQLLVLGSSKLNLLALRTVMNVVEAPAAQLSLGLLAQLASVLVSIAPNKDDPGPAAAYQYLLSAVIVRLAASETAAGGGDATAVTAAAAGTSVLGYMGGEGGPQGDLRGFDREEQGGGGVEGAAPGASTKGAFSGLGGAVVRLAPDGLPETLLGRDAPQCPRTAAALTAALPVMFAAFLSERAAVHVAAANALTSLLLATVTAPMVASTLAAIRAAAKANGTALVLDGALAALTGYPPVGTALPPAAQDTPVGTLVLCLEGLLSVKHQPAWPIALPMLAVAFRHLGLAAVPLLGRLLLALVELRASLIAATAPAADPGSVRGASAAAAAADDEAEDTQLNRRERSAGRKGRGEADPTLDAAVGGMSGLLQRMLWRILGSALRAVGVSAFLSMVPLAPGVPPSPAETAAAEAEGNATGAPSTGAVSPGVADERVWVLRLLKQHAKYTATELGTFTGVLLPAAQQCEVVAAAAEGATLPGNARAMRARASSIWALFPILCQCPSDVPEAFGPRLGKLVLAVLGKADPRYPDLPGHVCVALETLVTRLRLAAGLPPPVRPAYMGLMGAGASGDDTSSVGGFSVTSRWAGSTAGGSVAGSVFRGGGASVFGGEDEEAAEARASRARRAAKASEGGVGDMSAGAPAEARHPVLVASMGVGGASPKLTREEALAALDAVTAVAHRYLPVLFNVYERVAGTVGARTSTRATRVLHAIAAFVAVAPEDLVATFTGRLVGRTADALQTVASAVGGAVESATAGGRLVLKPGQSLRLNKRKLAILAGESPAVSNALTRMTALLSLALTLVPRLSPAQAGELFKVIHPALSEAALPTQQKRAYQVLLALLTTQPAFMETEATKADIVQLLRASLFEVSPSARKARLRCLEAVVAALDPLSPADRAIMAGLMGDVMLCTKDPNGSARTAAVNLLLTIVYALSQVAATAAPLGLEVGGGVGAVEGEGEDAGPTTELSGQRLVADALPLIMTGLTSDFSPTVAAAVQCLSRVVYEFAEVPEVAEALPSLLNSALALVPRATTEVMKAVVTFARAVVVAFPPAAVQGMVRGMLATLMKVPSEKARAKSRAGVKLLLLKLHRKFGEAFLEPLVPTEDQALLRYIAKQAARKVKKRHSARATAAAAMAAVTAPGAEEEGEGDVELGGDADGASVVSSATGGTRAPVSFEALLDEEDAGLADAMTSASGGTSFTGVTANVPEDEALFRVMKASQGGGRKARRGAASGGSSWIQETGDEPLDLLSPTAVRHVVGTDPAKLAQWKRTASASSAASSATAAEDGSLAMGDGISLDADGRVRIEFGAGDGSDSDSDSDSEDASGRPSHHRERKPGKKVAGGAMGAAAAAASAHANSQGWDLKRPGQRGNRSAAAAAAGEAGRYTGAAFRSKKAKGDVQRKGSKFEPFAYVALDPRAMSGRGGAKSVARFHNVTASTMKRGSGKRGRSVAKIAAAALTKEERSKRKRSR